MQFVIPFLVFLVFLVSFPVFAENNGLEGYKPPPMFSTDEPKIQKDSVPLPPKRPEKLNVPQSYIQKLLIEDAVQHDLEGSLSKPDQFDILDHIDPQN